MSNLVMDKRFIWNKSSLKEIEEAKKYFNEYKNEGYLITLNDKKTLIERFNPLLEEFIVLTRIVTKHVLKVLTEKGDERIVWDKDNGNEAKQAKAKFNELLKKGYSAYSVDNKGQKNRKITEFDIDAEEILMIPQTVKG